MKISKEFRNGLFAIIAFALLIVGYKYLSGTNMFKSNREYVVYYPNVGGLQPGNPITFRGVEIGLVKDVQFAGDNFDSVRVTIIIDHDQFRMKEKTSATLGSDGFLGGRKIDLKFGDTSLAFARQGDILIPLMEKDLQDQIQEQVAPLKKKAEDLIATIDTVVRTITAFWDENTTRNISSTVAGFKNAVQDFSYTAATVKELVTSQQGKLASIIANIMSISKNLADNSENITTSLANISSFSDQLKQSQFQETLLMAQDAIAKFNLIIAQINSGEGTVGNLIYDNELHKELVETNAYLQLLVDDIRNFPNRYLHFSIFGSRDKGIKLNKDETNALKDLLDLQKTGELRRFTNSEMDSLMNIIHGDKPD